MEVKVGNYVTRDGSHASVWEWGKDAEGTECWLGTVRGGGLNAWNKEGHDMSGTTEWDLVSKKE